MHAITVVGFEADALLIHDPAVANFPIRVSLDQFEAAWAYSRQLSIQIERS